MSFSLIKWPQGHAIFLKDMINFFPKNISKVLEKMPWNYFSMSQMSQSLLAPDNNLDQFQNLAKVTSANPLPSAMRMVSSPYHGPLSS